MASLRGSTTLWSAQATSAAGDTTPEAFVGTQTNVCVFVSNTGTAAVTFKVQVASPAGNSAGRNTDPGKWYDLTGKTITVAASTNGALDLSPFASPYLRLVRTDTNGATTVDISVTGIGQN